jgi:hypothetical protein
LSKSSIKHELPGTDGGTHLSVTDMSSFDKVDMAPHVSPIKKKEVLLLPGKSI